MDNQEKKKRKKINNWADKLNCTWIFWLWTVFSLRTTRTTFKSLPLPCLKSTHTNSRQTQMNLRSSSYFLHIFPTQDPYPCLIFLRHLLKGQSSYNSFPPLKLLSFFVFASFVFHSWFISFPVLSFFSLYDVFFFLFSFFFNTLLSFVYASPPADRSQATLQMN